MTTYATTKDDALAKVAKGTVDLGYQTLVKPDRAIPNAHSASGVTYRLLLGDKVAADTIPQARYQKVVRTSDNEIELRVERAIPQGDHASSTPEPGAEFLEENTYLQPNHPAIQKVAHEVTKDEPNPWSRAVKLCEWVDEHMSNADFSVGLAPSSEVIETKRGDCTEHAILLAALARAAKIPSRVAMGLVYLEGTQSFGYHMWTEVYVDGDWFPLDGTLGTNGIGGGHIKIADASLKGVDANSAFLPIFKIIGKLKIQVEKVDA